MEGGDKPKICLYPGTFMPCVGSVSEISLHEAAFYGKIELVNLWIKEKPQLVNRPDVLGTTPLHYAALNGQYETFKILLHTNINGETSTEINSDLLDSYTKHSCNILHSASTGGNYKIITYLFEDLGKEITDKMKKYLSERQRKGKLPAHHALRSDAFDIFIYLYNKDEKIHRQRYSTFNGQTFLTIAAKTGNFETFRFFYDNKTLFPRKISPNKLYRSALRGGNLEILKFTLAHKDEISQYTYEPKISPKHIFDAIRSGKTMVVQYLIENYSEAFFNEIEMKKGSPKFEMTAECFAAYRGEFEIVEYFFEKCSHLFSTTHGKKKKFPIHFAATSSKKMIEIVLHQLNNDLNDLLPTYSVIISNNSFQWNIFHFATLFCDTDEVFIYLYEKFQSDSNLALKLDEFLSGEKFSKSSVLNVAIRENNIKVIDFLNEKKSEMVNNYLIKNVGKLFIIPASKKYNETTKYLLLHYGKYLTHTERKVQNSPLCLVSRWCLDVEILDLLFDFLIKDENSNEERKNEIIRESLKIALEFGNKLPVKLILKKFPTLSFDLNNFHIFHYAAKGGSLYCLKKIENLLGSHKVDIEKEKFIRFKDSFFTPLFLAVYFQHFDVVYYILTKLNVKPMKYEPGYPTVLHLACSPHVPYVDKMTLPPSAKILNVLLDFGAWRIISIKADRVLKLPGSDLSPFDVACSNEVRQILEKRCPETIAYQNIIHLEELNENIKGYVIFL